jgi:hypothetical protein
MQSGDELATLIEFGPAVPVGGADHPIPHIKTVCVYPPIPTRDSDWCAFFDGEEEAGDYGWGRTEAEAEAIADFIENYADDHYARLSEAA